MSGITQAKVGDKIPITLQLSDGDINQYPQAEVRDTDNNLLITLDLTHVANGMYQFDYVMPNETFLTTTYIVYLDAAHTTENTVYHRDIDNFVKIDLSDVWDVVAMDHQNTGSFGRIIKQIKNDIDIIIASII